MTVKNKLVRDRIPEIIENEGFNVSYKHLDDDDYLIEIGNKLREKTEELIVTNSVENMADIYELVMAYGNFFGYSRKDIQTMAESKNTKKGSFQQRTYLEWFDRKK